MPTPTNTTAVQRPDLGSLAWEYLTDGPDRGLIGLQVMPAMPVPEKSMEYPVIPIEAVLKLVDTARGDRGDYARDDFQFETGTFTCREYGLEYPISDAEANLYDRFFAAEEVATQIVVNKIMLGHESRVASALFEPTNAIANVGVSTSWDAAATATPQVDVSTNIEAMRTASGITPNTVVMSRKVMSNVMRTAELSDHVKYTNPQLVLGFEAQRALLASYFGVDQVLVGGAIKDSAKQGQGFSGADMWDDEYVSLCRVSDGSPNLKDPSFGRTFLWQEDAPQEVVVETYREEQTRSDVVRGRQHVAEGIIFTGANYLLSNITA